MDIMEFNRVREKFRKRIVKQLQNPDMALCPHFAASEGLINIQPPTLTVTGPREHCLIVVLDLCFVPARPLNAHSDRMHAFGTVSSSLGRNYQIPRYHCPWSICHPVTAHIVALCGVTSALTPGMERVFYFFRLFSSLSQFSIEDLYFSRCVLYVRESAESCSSEAF